MIQIKNFLHQTVGEFCTKKEDVNLKQSLRQLKYYNWLLNDLVCKMNALIPVKRKTVSSEINNLAMKYKKVNEYKWMQLNLIINRKK